MKMAILPVDQVVLVVHPVVGQLSKHKVVLIVDITHGIRVPGVLPAVGGTMMEYSTVLVVEHMHSMVTVGGVDTVLPADMSPEQGF
jgi:hypothetical protein